MGIARNSVIRGPGSVKLGAVQMFDREGIKADIKIETFDVEASAFGKLDTRRKDVIGTIGFRPCGRLTAGILGALFPHGTPSIGASLFGAADVATEVHSLAGQKVTFHASALTKMPNLKLSTTDTAFSGDAEITALRKNNTDPVTADSFATVAATAWAGAFDVADIKGGLYVGTWGTAVFQTAEGWDIEFEMGTTPHYADGIGTYDMTLDDVTVRAKCRPIGLSEADLLASLNIQGATAGLGATMRSANDLVIAATGGLTVTLKAAAMVEGPMEWGRNALRVGEIGFIAHRAIAGGVPAALFSVALTA
jgi:hypothetical protein